MNNCGSYRIDVGPIWIGSCCMIERLRNWAVLNDIIKILATERIQAFFFKLMPQSHHTLGSRTGCSRAVHGLFWTKSYVHSLGPYGTNFASPYGARRILMHEQPVNSPCGGRKGPRTAVCDARVGFLQIPVVSVPLLVHKGALWIPHGPRRIWKTLNIPVWGPYDARTGIARGPCGTLRIIRSNFKCTAVSSRTGPAAWCDHENITGVTFLWALH